jgi:hypothetical protein
MKNKLFITIIFLFGLLLLSSCSKESIDDTLYLNQIQETELTAKNSKIIDAGFNEYGFNWNAHHFNGILFNAIVGDNLYNDLFFGDWEPYTGNDEEYLTKYPLAVYLPWDYRHINLVMHWNEALISKEGIYPDDWIDSNGWITFHYSGMDEDGNRWSQFQKWVTAKSTDYILDGKWYNMNDEEIGIYYSLDTAYEKIVLIQVVNSGNIHPDFFNPYVNTTSSGLGKYKIH